MRALLIVLNGVGVGAAPDAAKFRDEGANTLGHLFEQCAGLELPALFSLGLGEIIGEGPRTVPAASHGRMRPRSAGKDTTSGNWEIAGIISQEAFANFERFPDTLLRTIETEAKVRFICTDARDDGAVMDNLPAEHLKTGNPILAALPDSLMGIYAHEEIIPRARLYEIARIARKYCTIHRISRVLAQPLTGKTGKITIAPEFREYPTVPPRTILNAISETGLHVHAIGGAAALFARSGFTYHHPGESDKEAFNAIERVWNQHHDGLTFASVCGPGLHGRMRNPREFAAALRRFDQWLAGFLGRIHHEDLLIITADHGSDPTFPGAGPTREEAPLLVKYDAKLESLGIRLTFADVAATLAAYFHLPKPWLTGTPFFKFPAPKHPSRR